MVPARSDVSQFRRIGPEARQIRRLSVRYCRRDREVLLEIPLASAISKSDFAAVQAIMDAKRRNSWHCKDGYNHLFAYNGYLRCEGCGSIVYTLMQKQDYYICKRRYTEPYSYVDRNTGSQARSVVHTTVAEGRDTLKTLARQYEAAVAVSHP